MLFISPIGAGAVKLRSVRSADVRSCLTGIMKDIGEKMSNKMRIVKKAKKMDRDRGNVDRQKKTAPSKQEQDRIPVYVKHQDAPCLTPLTLLTYLTSFLN